MWNMQLHSTRTSVKGSTASLTGLVSKEVPLEERVE